MAKPPVRKPVKRCPPHNFYSDATLILAGDKYQLWRCKDCPATRRTNSEKEHPGKG